MTFEANQGQTDAQAKFVTRGKGFSAFHTAGGMVLYYDQQELRERRKHLKQHRLTLRISR